MCENQLSFILILVTELCSPFMGKELLCFWGFFLKSPCLLFLIFIIMNLGMFSGSGDWKWLNVFQPSNAEVVDSKASIATSLFLKTFSLERETSKRKARATSLC